MPLQQRNRHLCIKSDKILAEPTSTSQVGSGLTPHYHPHKIQSLNSFFPPHPGVGSGSIPHHNGAESKPVWTQFDQRQVPVSTSHPDPVFHNIPGTAFAQTSNSFSDPLPLYNLSPHGTPGTATAQPRPGCSIHNKLVIVVSRHQT